MTATSPRPAGDGPTPATTVDVGPLEDFPAGSVVVKLVAGVEVGIINVDGALAAVRNWCPHRGAPVCEGELRGTMLPSGPDEFVPGMHGRVLHCPWHQWEFDALTGKALFGIDRRSLVRYPVEVAGGRVVVGTRRLIDSSSGGEER